MIEVPELTAEQTFEFLKEPLIAKLATVNLDGSPQLSPVWFLYKDDNVFIATYEKALKVSNIKRNPRVSLVVDSTDGGIKLKGVLFKGNAILVRGDECKRIEKKIYDKYLTQGVIEKDSVAAEFKRLSLASEDSVCIRFKPARRISWDYTRMRIDEMRTVY